jgi:hypothetical protein
MVRHNEVGVFADEEPTSDPNAAPFKVFYLLLKNLRVNDGAVTDYTYFTGMQYAGRHEMEHILVAFDDDGMTGIIAALIPGDNIRPFGKVINNFALTLVTPLSSYNDVSRHPRITR